MEVHRLIAAGLLLAAAGAALGQTPAPLALPTQTGRHTLSELGLADAILVPGDSVRVWNLSLPANASQGPDRWYIVHLEAEVLINASGPAGDRRLAYLTASLNRLAFASVKLESGPGDPLSVRWEFVNITGTFRGFSAESVLRLPLSNFPPLAAVRAGNATIELKLENAAGTLIDRATVFANSNIEVTPRSPPKLRIASVSAPREVVEGERFNVSTVLENQGGLPVKNPRVSLRYPESLFELAEGNSSIGFEWLTSQETVHWSLRARGSGAGTLRVAVKSESADSSPVAEGPIAVLPRGGAPTWVWGAGAVTMALAAGLFLLRRRRA